jgi:hypothetical protein
MKTRCGFVRPFAALSGLALLPLTASAALIDLTATGVINTVLGPSVIRSGGNNVAVADGTPFSVVFRLDTNLFPAGVVDGNGATVYNSAGSGGCTGVSLPQNPLQSSMISSTVILNGVTLGGQSVGSLRNCDFASLDDAQGTGDGLVVQQDAYDSQLTYYTDGTYGTVSASPTAYSINETRVNGVSISGILANNPFSPDELLAELVQTFTIDSYYGMIMNAGFERTRYICAPGTCYNEALADGATYTLRGSLTGLSGALVVTTPPPTSAPEPGTLGLFATAFAGLGFWRRRRKTVSA